MSRKHGRTEDIKTHSEYYAIQCLKTLYPEFNCTIKSESPDFISVDGSIGIEVVRAENQEENRKRNQLFKLYAPGITQKQRRHIISKLYVSSNKGYYDPCEEARNAYLKKIKKIGEPQFQIFNSNYLVILALMEHIEEQDAEAFLSFLLSQMTPFGYRFNAVFVISYEHIIKFDISKATFEINPLSCGKHYEANKLASEIVRESRDSCGK